MVQVLIYVPVIDPWFGYWSVIQLLIYVPVTDQCCSDWSADIHSCWSVLQRPSGVVDLTGSGEPLQDCGPWFQTIGATSQSETGLVMTVMAPPPSLGGSGLFAAESFEKRHHALPHTAALCGRHQGGAAAATTVAVVTRCEWREGGSIHWIGSFDFWLCHTPGFGSGRWSLSHQTLLVLNLMGKEDWGQPPAEGDNI